MTTTAKKPTKKNNYAAIASILAAAENAGIVLDMEDITYASLCEFIDHEVELLDNKAAAAAKRAAAKREEGDALREAVYNVLSTEDFMTVNEVLKALDNEDLSAQQVTARLTQLVKADKAIKDTVTVEATAEGGKSKKLTAYKAC